MINIRIWLFFCLFNPSFFQAKGSKLGQWVNQWVHFLLVCPYVDPYCEIRNIFNDTLEMGSLNLGYSQTINLRKQYLFVEVYQEK